MQAGMHRIEAALHRMASSDVSDGNVVELLYRLWRTVDEELSPIIGASGVRALLRRGLLLARRDHEWLSLATDVPAGIDPIEHLCQSLSTRSRPEATAAHLAVFQAFCRLLSGLLGDALTERLLEPVFASLSTGSTVQDASS